MKRRKISWDALAVLNRAGLTYQERTELIDQGHRELRGLNRELQRKVEKIRSVLPECRRVKYGKRVNAELLQAQELLRTANEVECGLIEVQGDGAEPRLVAWQHAMAEWLKNMEQSGGQNEPID